MYAKLGHSFFGVCRPIDRTVIHISYSVRMAIESNDAVVSLERTKSGLDMVRFEEEGNHTPRIFRCSPSRPPKMERKLSQTIKDAKFVL